MNLHNLVSGYIGVVNPLMCGEVQQSAGYINAGDGQLVGSIAGTTLTITAVDSGEIGVASVISGPAIDGSLSVVAQLSGTPGGVGTYQVNASQTCASDTILSQGPGERVPTFYVTTNVQMQVQALTGQEIKHLDSLNISGILRGVYINGRLQGLNRGAIKGGDVLHIPTCLTSQPFDSWLVVQVLEPWDAACWTKVAVQLLNPPEEQ